MGVEQGYSKIATSGLVFAYDTGDTVNSYIGEPTTNVMRQSNNVTGTQYGYNDEYSPCQLVKTWVPNLPTPVSTGATSLTQQAVNSIWHCLNWYDENEDGKRCLSAYIYPLTSGITNFTIGMVGDPSNSVIFNLDTGATTIGAGLGGANPFYTAVSGYPGWYRIGANIEGRAGGWVASIGLGQTGTYTPSSPFKSFYICGIQYERNIATHCTQFTPAGTTRSNSKGLLDISGEGNSIDLSSVSFNANAQLTFDGTDDFVNVNSNIGILSQYTVEHVSYYQTVNRMPISSLAPPIFYQYGDNSWYYTHGGVAGEYYYPKSFTINGWGHWAFTYDGANLKVYRNGIYEGQQATTGTADWTNGLKIGNYTYGNSYNWNGQIAVVKFYNRALTQGEISHNFNHYKSRYNIT